MPGISGIIKKITKLEDKNIVRTMTRCMMHEEFYKSGTYINENMGVLLGWVCHENSFSDCLPIWNEKRTICLIISGETFIEASEIVNLKTGGHKFKEGNASYLVHLYEENKYNFFEKLNGSFSGVLIDYSKKKIILFNDRYGLKRIYYHETNEGLYFSSEAKSLIKILPNLRELDMKSFGELFSCGCTLENRTIFKGISIIPSGSRWTFNNNKEIKKELYFKKESWEDLPRLNETQYYENLKKIFQRKISQYFSGTQKIAVSLTGGIDTRMIMAWAPCLPFKIPCYTFGGMYRDCADVKIARKVAEKCQQRHETILLNRKFFSEFPALAKKTIYYTDGTMDVSGTVELYINRIAREIAPVRMTGNYGDQILRRVIGFNKNSLFEGFFDSEFIQLIHAGCTTYGRIVQDNPASFWAFKQLPWHHFARFALEQTQVTTRSPFLDNEIVALSYQIPQSLVQNTRPSLQLIEDGNSDLVKIPTDRGVLLRPIPIISEARRLYQEFMIKAEYAFDYGMPQWLSRLNQICDAFRLERKFLGRHKFYHFRVWYSNELSKYVKDIILDQRTLTRPYLKGNYLEELVNSHLKGHKNYTREIHLLITSELIQRHLIEMR